MPEKIMNRSSDSSYMRTLRNKYADIEEVTGNWVADLIESPYTESVHDPAKDIV